VSVNASINVTLVIVAPNSSQCYVLTPKGRAVLDARRGSATKGEEHLMEIQILGWADLVTDTVDVSTAVTILLVVLRMHRNIAALLRVVRRLDRKVVGTPTGVYPKPS
jgi:hypothetical protein